MNDSMIMSKLDHSRLVALVTEELSKSQNPIAEELDEKLASAKVVAPADVPPDVVTMNSQVLLGMPDEKRELRLVYARPGKRAPGTISVLSAMGAALLGARVGTTLQVSTGTDERPVHILGLSYQPEQSGDWEL